MLRFQSSSFAIAGIIASAIPILIHLLNRRRFKTVHWAAMSFLLEAQQQQRRRLRIRDALLLASRMLMLIFLGLTLSSPFLPQGGMPWSSLFLGFVGLVTVGSAVWWTTSPAERRSGPARVCLVGLAIIVMMLAANSIGSPGRSTPTASRNSPVHAVLVIDNSRSLGVAALGGTLLDRAKAKAAEFIAALPLDSRISVIPLAGSTDPLTLDAYRNPDDARRAVDRIQKVDVAGRTRTGLELADQACRQTSEPAIKRVVLFTDLQASAWAGITTETLDPLPDLQIMTLADKPARNVWLTGLRVDDGLGGTETPCRILARIHVSPFTSADAADAPEPFDIQTSLIVDGHQVASQTVAVIPGQERELEFTHQFELHDFGQSPGTAVVAVELQAERPQVDQLADDNRQQIVVPIVSSLPVLFVDQYGDEEDLDRQRFGETYALRHLLAPRSSTDKTSTSLIQPRHLRLDQLAQDELQTARLVVIAGISEPDEGAVALLRDYVRQGGPLLLLAGGSFDPTAWTNKAWLDGRGLLPVPLDPRPFGDMPENTTTPLTPFFADYGSMQHRYFQIEGEDPQTIAAIFATTPFFKAVKADVNAATLRTLLQHETARFADERNSTTNAAENSAQANPSARPREPAWWKWRSPLPLVDQTLAAEDLARRGQPRVLASFADNHLPFVIERQVDAGRVLLFTSGVTSNWNLLRGSAAMYLFHRASYQLIEQTFPRRTFTAGEPIICPVERHRGTRYMLTPPSGMTELLPVDPLSPTAMGVVLRHPVQAGTYVVAAESTAADGGVHADARPDTLTFAVNGAESESNLTSLSLAELRTNIGGDHVRLLTADDAIEVASHARGQRSLWKACAALLLCCLLVEQAIVAWPRIAARFRRRETGEPA